MVFRSIHERAVDRDVEQAQRNLAIATQNVAIADSDAAAAEGAYKPESGAIRRTVRPWLLALAGGMEIPGAVMAAEAAIPGYFGMVVLAGCLTSAGLILGWGLGRTAVGLQRSTASGDEVLEFRILLALSGLYLAVLLGLRALFGVVVLGSAISSLITTVLSLVGIWIAYHCELNVESEEAARRRADLAQCRRILEQWKRRHDLAREAYQVAVAEQARIPARIDSRAATSLGSDDPVQKQANTGSHANVDTPRQTQDAVGQAHPNGAIVASVLIGIMVLSLGARAGAAPSDQDMMRDVLSTCNKAVVASPTIGTRFTVLLRGGSQVSPAQRAEYMSAVGRIVSLACRAPGATLVMYQIPTTLDFDDRVAFSEQATPDNGNPFFTAQSRARFVAHAMDAAAGIFNASTPGRSDVVSAIRTAANDIGGLRGSENLVFIIHDGWPQGTINAFRAGADPRREMSFVIRQVQKTGGLSLRNMNLVFAGIAAGPRMQATADQLFELCQAWRQFVGAFHGTFGGCGPHLPAQLRLH
jgi:hypothetical protein